jgi:hypothetical protein
MRFILPLLGIVSRDNTRMTDNKKQLEITNDSREENIKGNGLNLQKDASVTFTGGSVMLLLYWKAGRRTSEKKKHGHNSSCSLERGHGSVIELEEGEEGYCLTNKRNDISFLKVEFHANSETSLL